jgi:hypothetical protein
VPEIFGKLLREATDFQPLRRRIPEGARVSTARKPRTGHAVRGRWANVGSNAAAAAEARLRLVRDHDRAEVSAHRAVGARGDDPRPQRPWRSRRTSALDDRRPAAGRDRRPSRQLWTAEDGELPSATTTAHDSRRADPPLLRGHFLPPRVRSPASRACTGGTSRCGSGSPGRTPREPNAPARTPRFGG